MSIFSKEKPDPLLGILDRWNCRATVEMFSIMENCSMDEVAKKVFLNGLKAYYGEFVSATQPKPQQTVRVAEVQPMQPQRPLPAQKEVTPLKEVQPVQTDLFQKEKRIKTNIPSGCIRLYYKPSRHQKVFVFSADEAQKLKLLRVNFYCTYRSDPPVIVFSRRPIGSNSRPILIRPGTMRFSDTGFFNFILKKISIKNSTTEPLNIDIYFSKEEVRKTDNTFVIYYLVEGVKK